MTSAAPDRSPLRWWAPWAAPVSTAPARDVLVEVDPATGRIVGLRAGVARADAATLGAQLHDGCVLAPGFVNAHAHLEYAAYGGLADGMRFEDWITDHVHRKRRLAPEHMRASAELGAMSALHAGITTVGDASYSGDAAHALVAAGLRGRVYLEVFSHGEGPAGAIVDDAQARLAALPLGGIVEAGISPHAPYTVSEELYRAVADCGLPWMTHLLESTAELEFLDGRGVIAERMAARGLNPPDWQGRSPIQALGDVLGPHTLVVHAVHASGADREVLAAAGAPVAHCPRSNARLGCGRFDLAAADRAGLLVGLGTDSPASAGPIDMFAELHSALEQHRAATGDAQLPDADRLLRMATADAALALGYDDLGRLDVGAHADVIAVVVGATSDPVAALVTAAGAGDVRAVMVAGRNLEVRDRTRLERARDRAMEARALLALPVPPGRV